VSRRRRAALLLGLSLVLGGLAASDVARREAALAEQLGPEVEVVVAARELAAGRRLTEADLALRRVPARYAPPGDGLGSAALLGERLAVPVPAGGQVTPFQLETDRLPATAELERGERAVDVVAAAAPDAVVPGARVDVVVTREHGEGRGAAELALEDVAVLAARPALAAEENQAPRVAATVRVTLRQAVYLAAAQAFAREIRLLARARGDRRQAGPFAVDAGLGG
jgi:pilus assembly protein CpaB